MDALSKLDKIVSMFLKLNKDLLLPHMDIFIKVANHEGITMPDLIKETGIKQSSISRYVKALSQYYEIDQANPSSPEPKGLGLLRVEPDMVNRKRYAVFLTEKGRKFKEELERI